MWQFFNKFLTNRSVLSICNFWIVSGKEFLFLKLDAIPRWVGEDTVKTAFLKDRWERKRPMENAVLAAGSGTTGERFGTRVRASRASGQDSVEFCRRGDRGVWSLLRQRRTVAKVPDLNIDQCLGQQERRSEHICRKAEMIEAALFPELGVGGFLRLDLLKRVLRHLVDAAHLVGDRMHRPPST